MAEMEQEAVEVAVDERVATEAENAETEDITYEQALEWKRQAEELAEAKKKAEAKIVEMKKEGKQKPVSTQEEGGEVYTKQDAILDKFVARNPSLEGYEDDLKRYVKMGNTLEEAKILVENKDKSAENKRKLSATSVLHTEGTRSTPTSFTRDALAKMSQGEYNAAMNLVESGKATLS